MNSGSCHELSRSLGGARHTRDTGLSVTGDMRGPAASLIIVTPGTFPARRHAHLRPGGRGSPAIVLMFTLSESQEDLNIHCVMFQCSIHEPI